MRSGLAACVMVAVLLGAPARAEEKKEVNTGQDPTKPLRPGDEGWWFVPLNFMGELLTPKVVTSVEVGVPIVDDCPVYDFKIELRVGLFF